MLRMEHAALVTVTVGSFSLLLTWVQGNLIMCPDCPCLKTLDFGGNEDIMGIHPIHYNIVVDTPLTNMMDNVCETFFPFADNPNASIIYQSVVMKDGTNKVSTYIRNYRGEGMVTICPTSDLARTTNHFFLGPIGCDTFLKYRCPMRSDDCTGNIGAMASKPTKLTKECLANAQKLVDDNNLDIDLGMYIQIPNKLPPQCVYEPTPIYNNPF